MIERSHMMSGCKFAECVVGCEIEENRGSEN